jgi:hypothetical protein
LCASDNNTPSQLSDSLSTGSIHNASFSRSICLHVQQQHHLVLSHDRRELETHSTTGQALVDLGVGVESVVDGVLLLLVEDNLQDLAAVLLGAEALADDLDGVDEVVEDGVVDSGQGSGAGSLLREGGARAVGALGTGQDAARGEDDDMAVGELLLELTGETACPCVSGILLITCDLSACRGWGRTYRCCTLWKPWRDGTGTKMTIAFLPWPTSIYR